MYTIPSDIPFMTNPGHSLIMPTVLADEFLLGYLGRIASVNNRGSVLNIKITLTKWFHYANPEIKAPPFVFVLANILGIETSTIVKQHTLIPILHATQPEMNKYQAKFGIGCNHDFELLKKLSFLYPKKVACFCESCVVEDLDCHWFSFWRRSHQLPGIDWCSKHMEPLQEVYAKSAFSKQPSIFFNSGNYSKQSESLSKKNPVILRFAKLIKNALELDVPVNNMFAKEVLLNKARSIGVKHSKTRSSKQLSDVMNEVLPEQWIIKYFPRLKKESCGEYVSGFDEVLKSSRQGKSYVNTLLAAAVLFDDADEAINELTSQKNLLFDKKSKQEISDITFNNAYVRYRGSYIKMGAELDKDRRYIFNRARSLGLPSLTRADPITFQAVKDFYDGGSLVELLSRPNVSKEKFENIIRLSGRQFSSTIKKIDSID